MVEKLWVFGLTIRGVQVMLDRDLAELYDVPAKVLEQALGAIS